MRIRTIKPEFLTSLTNARLPLDIRITFEGLWMHCDDGGRCVDDSRLIQAAIWPLPVPRTYGGPEKMRTPRDVENDLTVLAKEDKIVRYRADDIPYLQVTNWRRHQVINRPTKSRIPPPEGYDPSGNRITAPTQENQ